MKYYMTVNYTSTVPELYKHWSFCLVEMDQFFIKSFDRQHWWIAAGFLLESQQPQFIKVFHDLELDDLWDKCYLGQNHQDI